MQKNVFASVITFVLLGVSLVFSLRVHGNNQHALLPAQMPEPVQEIRGFSLQHPDLKDLMIASATKDSFGRLWIGSETGLFRYDGYFVDKIDAQYTSDGDAPVGVVTQIVQLDEMHLLIRTDPQKLSLFNILTNQYVKGPYQLNAISTQTFSYFQKYKEHISIVLANHEVVFFDTKMQTSSIFKHPFNQDFYEMLLVDSKLYLLSRKDLIVLSIDDKTIETIVPLPTKTDLSDRAQVLVHDGNVHLLNNNHHWKLSEGQFVLNAQLPLCELPKRIVQGEFEQLNRGDVFHLQGHFSSKFAYYADHCGIYRYSVDDGHREILVENETQKPWFIGAITDLTIKTNEIMLFSTLSGIFLYDTQNGLRRDPTIPEIRSFNRVFQAGENMIGVELNTKGGTFYSSLKSHFSGLDTHQLENLLGTDKLRRALFIDRGTLAVATQDNGLFILALVPQSNNRWQVKQHFLKQAHVRTLYIDKKQLWVGTERSGIYILDISSMQWRSLSLPSGVDSAFSFLPVGENKLLINTHNDILLIDKLSLDEPLQVERRFNQGGQFRALAIDDENNIWVGSHERRGFITQLDAQLNEIERYSSENSNLAHQVFDLHFDAQGNLWAATWGGGLAMKKPEDETFVFVTEQDGLASNTVFSVYPGNDGNLWASTARGLSRIKPCDIPCTWQITNFGTADGLSTINFDAEAHYMQTNPQQAGTFVFAGIGGLVWFNPAQDIADNTIAPAKVSFNEAYVNGQLLPSSLLAKDDLILPYGTEQLDLTFTSTNFITPANNQYRYRINDGNWINSEAPKINLSFLSPGSYLLEASSANNQGIWSAQPAKLTLVITKPWWQSGLAYFIYLCLLVVGVYIFTLWRTRLVKQRNAALEALVSSRTQALEKVLKDKERIFENISHELRTPLTIILGKAEQLLAQTKDSSVVLIYQQSTRLFELVEQLLKLAELRSIQLKTIQVALYAETQRLIAAITPLADSKKIRIVCTLDIDKNTSVQLREDTLALVMNNLLKNAIAYSPLNTQVCVHICIKQNDIIIKVSDEGSGFKNIEDVFERFQREHKGESGSGLGLAIVKQIVEANGGSVFIKNLEKGATVEVKLPLVLSKPTELHELDTEQTLFADTSNFETVSGHILLVENEPQMQQYIESVLLPYFTLTICNDGREAMAMLNKNKLPDLIVSDVMMPNIDGFELSKQIKTNDELAHLPVILLSAKADTQSQRDGLRNLADDYITKPFSTQTLIMKISNQLKTRFAHSARLQTSLIQNELSINTSKNSEFADKIRAEFAAHFADPNYSLSQTAKRMHLSEKTLTRRLNSIFNNTFTALLRDFRLHQAQQMLKQGESVREVTFACGFNSETYFGRCYKKRYGTTPTKTKKVDKTSKNSIDKRV